MTFTLFVFLSLVVGILVCMPVATYISPPTISLMVVLFAPWMLLYYFSQSPLIQDIRYLYLSFLIGVCCYWTYFETMKKLKGR